MDGLPGELRYAELEIGLYQRGLKSCTVEMRFSVDDDLQSLGPWAMELDLEGLSGQMYDVEAYGELLTGRLFGTRDDQRLRHVFADVRELARQRDQWLRVRLRIGPSTSRLHGVWWETLRDPKDGTALLTDEKVLFSRYLSSLDWPSVGVRSRPRLSALIVIANPSNLADYETEGRRLALIDVSKECEGIERALRGMPFTTLASGGAATLERMIDELGKGGHHILYLACHGYLHEGQSQLLLENPDGTVARVTGDDLADALRDLRYLPRLVVLASCQSAGPEAPGGPGALVALGPRMAKAGVPAVLAMHSSVSMKTVAGFMPVFFRELDHDGQIDRAVTVARRAVQNRDDWWAPVLFMRLQSGRLWYAPVGGKEFPQWRGLCSEIEAGNCTPVLGPGLTDAFLGSRHEVARGWANQEHFPLAHHHREDLPRVAQYLAVDQGLNFPRTKLVKYIRKELLEHYGSHLPPEAQDWQVDQIGKLVAEVGEYRRSIDRGEPHAVLARLPFKTFVTTHPSDLLEDALRAEGKDPQREMCRWKDANWPKSIFDDGTSPYEPISRRPLVYHLFGYLREPNTIVLTEDDYFDYLVGVTSGNVLIPVTVRRTLADSGLLFLGFRLDEWDFRVLLRSIISQPGMWRRKQYLHVAAQIDPEDDRTIHPDRARRYLEEYFSQLDQIRVSIYWGSVEDFTQELSAQWDRWREEQ